MHHHVAHAAGHALLFHSWPEGLALWAQIRLEVPQLAGLVLMPDHVHLLHPHDVRARLAHAIGSYVHHRNARRGRADPGVRPLPAGGLLVGLEKERRSERYLYLNPTRAHLAKDPLEWPLSTYRDRVGLAAWPVVPTVRGPARFHAYVSADPSVDVSGTPFPTPVHETDDLIAVLTATSAVTRTPLSRVRLRGPARTLFLRAAAALCPSVPRSRVAELVGVRRAAARTAAREVRDPAIRAVSLALGDPRFPALDDRDLRGSRGIPR